MKIWLTPTFAELWQEKQLLGWWKVSIVVLAKLLVPTWVVVPGINQVVPV